MKRSTAGKAAMVSATAQSAATSMTTNATDTSNPLLTSFRINRLRLKSVLCDRIAREISAG